MIDQKENLTNSIKFLQFTTLITITMEGFFEIETQHLLGKIDLYNLEHKEILNKINECNDIFFQTKKVFKNYTDFCDFEVALNIFRENINKFTRRLPCYSKLDSQRKFLLNNETAFMYCITLFFHYMHTYDGPNKYLLSYIDLHENMIKDFKSQQARLWGAELAHKIEISIPIGIRNAIAMLKELSIEGTKGNRQKIAIISFYLHFGKQFKITQKNDSVAVKITHALILAFFPGTSRNHVGDTLVPFRKLVLKCN